MTGMSFRNKKKKVTRDWSMKTAEEDGHNKRHNENILGGSKNRSWVFFTKEVHGVFAVHSVDTGCHCSVTLTLVQHKAPII